MKHKESNVGALTDRLPDGPAALHTLVAEKHREYHKKARRYAVLFYTTRLTAGFSAGLLPFVVRNSPNISTALAILIVLATVVDTVFAPKDRWALFSKATDLLALEQLRASGQTKEWEAAWRIIESTEASYLRQLTGLQELLERIRTAGRR